MTFPADLASTRDNTLTPSERRVYDYLRGVLDHQVPRRVKTQVECEAIASDRETFSLALNGLVAKGYLVEHPREMFKVRVFTLAWALPGPSGPTP